MRTKIFSLDVTRPLQAVALERGDEGLDILVRAKEQVLGWVRITAPGNATRVVSVEQLTGAIMRQASWKIVERHLGRQFDPFWNAAMSQVTPISIVVCTTDEHPEKLQSLLQSISSLTHTAYEVVLVSFGALAKDRILPHGERNLSHVRVEGGLSSARNEGIKRSAHDLIAFVSERAIVDPGWLTALDRAVSRGIMGVTGYVAPLGSRPAGETITDKHFKWVRNKFTRQVFRETDGTAKQLPQPGNFGSGVNMAFRREIFHTAGMFDPVFDALPAEDDRGADDMFLRVLQKNGLLLYEPSMLAWLSQ